MRLSPDGRDVGRAISRSNGQEEGERAPLQKNFRDRILRYACNAATDPKQMLKALGKMPQGVADPKSLYPASGRNRLAMAQIIIVSVPARTELSPELVHRRASALRPRFQSVPN